METRSTFHHEIFQTLFSPHQIPTLVWKKIRKPSNFLCRSNSLELCESDNPPQLVSSLSVDFAPGSDIAISVSGILTSWRRRQDTMLTMASQCKSGSKAYFKGVGTPTKDTDSFLDDKATSLSTHTKNISGCGDGAYEKGRT